MNEEERNDKKKDESLLDKLGKGVKKNNKSKFKMIAAKLAALRFSKISPFSCSIAKPYNKYFAWWNNNNI